MVINGNVVLGCGCRAGAGLESGNAALGDTQGTAFLWVSPLIPSDATGGLGHAWKALSITSGLEEEPVGLLPSGWSAAVC